MEQGNPDDPAARFLAVAVNSPAIDFPESGSDPEFDRRTKVLLIAAKSFLKKGYSATSIDEIAEAAGTRSEEHTSELQSLMRISYAVFCLKKKKPYKQ